MTLREELEILDAKRAALKSFEPFIGTELLDGLVCDSDKTKQRFEEQLGEITERRANIKTLTLISPDVLDQEMDPDTAYDEDEDDD